MQKEKQEVGTSKDFDVTSDFSNDFSCYMSCTIKPWSRISNIVYLLIKSRYKPFCMKINAAVIKHQRQV